jgi:tetratricopeptide (TPR) repeat protein
LAALAQDRPMMESLYQRSLRRASHWATGGVFGFTWGQPVELALGRLAFALGRLPDAAEHYQRALGSLRGSGARAYHAWIAYEASSVLAALGDHDGARALRAEAEALAKQLGILLPALTRTETTPPAPPVSTSVPEVAFLHMRHEGDYWTIDCEGRACRVRDGKGIAMLARPVEHVGRELHVLDLASPGGGIDRGDGGELFDARARQQYQDRIASLRAEIEQAEACADLGRAQRREERSSRSATNSLAAWVWAARHGELDRPRNEHASTSSAGCATRSPASPSTIPYSAGTWSG